MTGTGGSGIGGASHRPGEPLAAHVPELAHVVDGLSKRVAPGLTVGFLVVPPDRAEAVAAAVRSGGWSAGRFALEAGVRWIEDGTVARLVAAKRLDAARRQRLLARELAEFGGAVRSDPSRLLRLVGAARVLAGGHLHGRRRGTRHRHHTGGRLRRGPRAGAGRRQARPRVGVGGGPGPGVADAGCDRAAGSCGSVTWVGVRGIAVAWGMASPWGRSLLFRSVPYRVSDALRFRFRLRLGLASAPEGDSARALRMLAVIARRGRTGR